MHIPSTVGGKAAVNDTLIQRLFVKFFADVLIGSTGQEVVVEFAYECLHVGNILLKFYLLEFMLLYGNLSFQTYYASKEKIQLCVLVSMMKFENLHLEMVVDKWRQMSK